MKRLLLVKAILITSILLTGLPTKLFCASIGGAETQGQNVVGVCLDNDFIFDREMKFLSFSPEKKYEIPRQTSKIDKVHRMMVKVCYGLVKDLDIYVKLGAADFKGTVDYNWQEILFPQHTRPEHVKINGSYSFAYGAGVKFSYLIDNLWIIGCDTQYTYHKNDYAGISHFREYFPAGVLQEAGEMPVEGSVAFMEWQVAPYIGFKLEKLVPYAGIKYSDLRTDYRLRWMTSGDEEFFRYKANRNIGIFFGSDFEIIENLIINAEARILDETAISVALTYKF